MRKIILALLLAATLDAPVQFDRNVYDFGEISIKDGPQKCCFTMTNVSDEPVLILQAVASCGCTSASWTRTPVQPGETGKIEVVYDNDEMPSVFDKTVAVYVSAQKKPIILHLRGKSTNRKEHE